MRDISGVSFLGLAFVSLKAKWAMLRLPGSSSSEADSSVGAGVALVRALPAEEDSACRLGSGLMESSKIAESSTRWCLVASGGWRDFSE